MSKANLIPGLKSLKVKYRCKFLIFSQIKTVQGG